MDYSHLSILQTDHLNNDNHQGLIVTSSYPISNKMN